MRIAHNISRNFAAILWALFFFFVAAGCQNTTVKSPDLLLSSELLTDAEKLDATLEQRAAEYGDIRAGIFFQTDDGNVTTIFIGDDVNENSLFQAASLSKAVAAFGIISLAQREGISLDEDIRPLTPSLDWTKIKGGDQPVTLRELLSHTAGASVGGFMGYNRDKPLPSSIDIVQGSKLSNSFAVKLTGETGVFSYSGGGYQIAQVFAQDVSGQPFDVFMQDTVLAPLGMTSSTFAQPINPKQIAPLKIAPANSGFLPLQGVFRPMKDSWRNYPEQAAAGLWTTASDYARFIRALSDAFNGAEASVISPNIARLMLTEVDAQYGLGVMLGFAEDGTLNHFSHSGANTGYRSYFRAWPEQNRMIVIMTNSPQGAEFGSEIVLAFQKEGDEKLTP